MLVSIVGVHACTDISDGLVRDAQYLLQDMQDIRWFDHQIPMDPALIRYFGREKALKLALEGGEDFELILACDPTIVTKVISRAKDLGIGLSVVGEVIRASKKITEKQINRAYEHFRV